MPDSIRAFVAIGLPEDVIDRIRALQNDLRCQDLNIRWVKPHNIHLTLKFLGDIAGERVPEIEQALVAAAAGQAPFEISARGIGVFPTVKKPRVLWVGVASRTETLRALQQAVEQHLAGIGFAPEKRPFTGHLTLGRAKGVVNSRRLLAAMQAHGRFETAPFRVERLALYRSQLKPQGAVYNRLVDVPLGDDR